MSDDDDDVGLDSGMEPELTMDQAAAGQTGGDDGDDDMDVLPAGAATPVATPRGTRPVSQKVREMFAELAKKSKAGEEAGDEDVAITEGIEPATGEAAKPAEAASQAAAVPAPAPSLDPEVGKLREQWTAKVAELDAREQALRDRESASDMDALRELYTEKGAPAVVRFLKTITGLDGDDLKSEIADLVTDLSAAELGVEVPGEIRQRLDTKRAQRSIKAMKESLAQREARTAKEREAAQEAEKRNYAIHLLREEIKKPDHQKLYPHLAVEDDPGTLIVEVYERRIKEGRDPKAYTWGEAAKEVNTYLENQARAFFDRRKHLLTAAPDNGKAKQGAQPTRETTQGQRRSPAAPTQPTPPAVPIVKNGRYDAEAHRRQTKAKVRALFQPSSDD